MYLYNNAILFAIKELGVFMKNNTTQNFFDQPKEKSKIKVYIVTEFFKRYFSIINNCGFSDEIYYIDLFCGPGIYKDGTKSTPIALLDIVNSFEKDDIRNKLVMLFNDENLEFYKTLTKQVYQHPVYPKLKHKPILLNQKASEVDLTDFYSNKKPKFSFIDPWGYIDVDAEQISKLVRSIGSDCVLFFNANRILQDLGKTQSETHMKRIFGSKYDDVLAVQKNGFLSQRAKAHKFVVLFSQNLYNTYFATLKKQGYRLFLLPFAVEQDDVEKISHYLLFITKNHKATLEMKKIMLKKSNTSSELLGYDNKDELTISLFCREDDICGGIYKLLIKLFQLHPKVREQKYNIYEWLETMDAFSMSLNYEVTPYTAEEFKKCVEKWDIEEKIDILLPAKKTIKKRITNDRKFSFNESFGE